MTKYTITLAERQMLENLFSKMNDNDLNLIAKLHSARNKSLSAQEASQFHVGETVTFHDKVGRIVEGVIQKVNVKTIKIVVGGSARWSVSPSLLTKVA
jgi:hypothetical protein